MKVTMVAIALLCVALPGCSAGARGDARSRAATASRATVVGYVMPAGGNERYAPPRSDAGGGPAVECPGDRFVRALPEAAWFTLVAERVSSALTRTPERMQSDPCGGDS